MFRMILAAITIAMLLIPASFSQGCPGHAAAAAEPAKDGAAPADAAAPVAATGTEATVKTAKLACAVFELPELSDEIAKDFAKAIGKEKGIVAVKPDMEQKQIMVVFDEAVMNQEVAQKLVVTNFEKAKFIKMTDVPKDIKAGCGACPNRTACQKTGK